MGLEREMSREEEARARVSSYELLALGMSPPSAELTEAISKAPVSLPVPEPAALIPEYHRLFVGPGSLPAPPYESVYREGWAVMGETTLEVKRQFEQAGYALAPSSTELPDHLAVELAFMALLAEEEAKAWAAEDVSTALSWLERERAFLGDHLARWLPDFCDRLLASTKAPFYRRLAVVLQEFVTLDAERVKALTGFVEEALA